MATATAAAGAWLLVDVAYDAYIYNGGASPPPPSGPNVITVHTFSKTYGLAGWRVGYLLHPAAAVATALTAVVDTEATHASRPAQALAAALLGAVPPAYVAARVAEVGAARDAMYAAGGLGAAGVALPAGGYYFLVPLPGGWAAAEAAAGEVLATEARVLVAPGGGYGAPGTVRVAFAAVAEVGGGTDAAAEGGRRLRRGLDLLAGRPPPGKGGDNNLGGGTGGSQAGGS